MPDSNASLIGAAADSSAGDYGSAGEGFPRIRAGKASIAVGVDNGDSVAAERMARGEAAFRAANEDIYRTARTLGIAERVPFLCECGDGACTQFVRLALDEYERVRAQPNRFVIVRGHQGGSGTETPIDREGGNWVVVEKRGSAGRLAARLDPRADDEHR